MFDLPPSGLLGLAAFGLTCLPICSWLRRRGDRATRTSRQQAELDVFRIARRDPLTGLATRSDFSATLTNWLRTGSPAALMLVNVDGLSAINDEHGLQRGDEVLVAIADRLRSLVPDLSRLARLGDDEFAVLLDAAAGVPVVEAKALSIQRAFLGPLQAGAHPMMCNVSLGIALTPGHAETMDGLVRAAQAALRQVKSGGGKSFRFFDPAAEAALRHRAQLKLELREAIAMGEIVPFYQPIMDLQTNMLTGFEVLARWRHPVRGLLPPDVFIPMAEEMQLAGQITQSLMRRVIIDAGDWPDWLYFAFNVSPGQLRELIGMIRSPPAWLDGQIDPARIEVEITESALIEDIDVAREVISLLQARGTRVVLDDFGIGFSNFFHLRELPFDRIKIDKSFVLDLARDPRADACVRAMLALAGSLGIDMVAEGLETDETEAYVSLLGCRYGQGFLYSSPVSAASVPALIRRLKPPAAVGGRETLMSVLNSAA